MGYFQRSSNIDFTDEEVIQCNVTLVKIIFYVLVI